MASLAELHPKLTSGSHSNTVRVGRKLVFIGMSTTKVLGFNLTVLAWEGLSGGPRIGYVPDSTLGPGQKRRLDGESVARTLSDTASGRDIARTQPGELMRFTRDGTIVVVHSRPGSPKT